MSILKPFQIQATSAFWDALTPDVNRIMIEMATGLGKTITFAGVIDMWLRHQARPADRPPMSPPAIQGFQMGRALVLVHTDELIQQAVERIRFVTRGRWSIGVVKAGRNEVAADIVVASVQTLRRIERREQIQDVGLIVVDECHHAVANSYQDILEHFGGLPLRYDLTPELNRPATTPVLGVTATPARTDGIGLGSVWQELAFSRNLPWAIRHGHLIPFTPWLISIPGVDSAASEVALDYQLAEGLAPEAVVKAWLDKAASPLGEPMEANPSTVLFAPLVKSAEAFADAFNTSGIKAEVVHGGMADTERRAVLERYEAGVTTVICNAMVLTEGWDSPRTMCVIIARPTQSVPLVVQMLGRGLRPWLSAEAPPREEQRCTVLVVQGAATKVVVVADLSEAEGQMADMLTGLAMDDEWDIGVGLDPEPELYSGPVRVELWDAIVQQSSKAWKYTEGGIPFLPTAKKRLGYVFVVERDGLFQVWTREAPNTTTPALVKSVITAPDLELAMAAAEDECLERGGNIAALLADKSRAWRKAVPSPEMVTEAKRVGVPEYEILRIQLSKSAGKAGRLSDLIDRKVASRVLDPVASKIRARSVVPS